MAGSKVYFFFIIWVVNTIAAILLFPVSWIFALVFLALFIIHSIVVMKTYFNSNLWHYSNWIDTTNVDIEKVEIPSSQDGLYLKAVVIRKKNSDRAKKHVGILCAHGYNSCKEDMYFLTIPLALNGYVVVCPDDRASGESKNKAFINLGKGKFEDVENQITFLENLEDVDKNRLMMIGGSLGGWLTITSGYDDARIKRLVAICAAYDLYSTLKENKTLIGKIFFRTMVKLLKKESDFQESGLSLEEWNRLNVEKIFKFECNIPDKERVYLAHVKNDTIVSFQESIKMKKLLNLPDENVLILEFPSKKLSFSGHGLTGQSTIISTFCINVAKTLE